MTRYDIPQEEQKNTFFLQKHLLKHYSQKEKTRDLLHAKVYLAVCVGFPQYYQFSWFNGCVYSNKLCYMQNTYIHKYYTQGYLHRAEADFLNKYGEVLIILEDLKTLKRNAHPEISDEMWFNILASVFYLCDYYQANINTLSYKESVIGIISQNIRLYFPDAPKHIEQLAILQYTTFVQNNK